jgi:hypothetical protein
MSIKKVKFVDPEYVVLVYSEMSVNSVILASFKKSDLITGTNFTIYTDSMSTDKQGRPPGTNNFYKIDKSTIKNLKFKDNGFVIINPRYLKFVTGEESTSRPPTYAEANRVTATGEYVTVPNLSIITSDDTKELNGPIDKFIPSSRSDGIIKNREVKSVHKDINVVFDVKSYNQLIENNLSAFNRFNIQPIDLKFNKGFGKVFFTRPDLNFFDSIGTSSVNGRRVFPKDLNENISPDLWFRQLYNSDPHILASLTDSYSSKHHFHPLLSNAAQSFDLTDEKLETMEHGETFTGWKLKYGKHNIGSRTAGSFSVAYDETNRIEIYKTHKAWIEYISKVYRGEFPAKRKYIEQRVLDYAVSAYYFVLGPDGESIVFWSKYIGVFPTVAPSGEFSWSKGDIIKHPEITIEYEYSWKEDVDVMSLIDFNYNAGLGNINATNGLTTNMLKSNSSLKSDGYTLLNVYDTDLGHTGFAFASLPVVVFDMDDNGKFNLKLKYLGKPSYD